MTPEQAEKLQEHVQEIAKILYANTELEELKTFSGIEQTVREQMQQHVMPEVGIFLSQQVQEQQKDENASSKASLER
jgi:predicted component of type VI protein secretion system